ncbi:hypothetical protein ElyMa_000922000 [Elysia marginata]|uniref:Uncharacterized protein n=1 Tax=Elysia marginata TaxID=1093978 RepID=A0AAV4H8Y1_9GAST|nr:hypothetical protein ElyMa_000922000 [Elysia marginata]
MRREKLEHLITTGKLDGKRGRGKQREKMMDGLKRWLGSGSLTETMTARFYGTSGVMEKHDRRRFKAWHWMMMILRPKVGLLDRQVGGLSIKERLYSRNLFSPRPGVNEYLDIDIEMFSRYARMMHLI